ncbi:peptide chain release factor N(5)-glutamine methyltransferase [Sulfitobacter mediterraneus]|jgi:release factor glutamine methyltransferase|uniref:peptide chain release factor N(5)-glutamine methyltransferase n=1 Tax=Sulfitobacter TaxID=60136 RepID=UPI0019321F29|nr:MULTISPECIES: peptide chain release factor N(5)-glutamine methyltransferase [Sulfitobacter]MBM1632248.1 peptide chain release factor N(5)-glutamine methyltransferase [Sulfitobacter mediterraneus]MBM1640064.1 peptide chain release factor N(5)-glutamine methyltransferase [Sulfitobacter mediterraneus]MBM1644113.1 peptide chain release factor N(5)-glutamine methyltransferase [Sulfitobacter mediterraneus]MBM1648159.1 peptide chain release factor N(5)-glutamine methyltransferase [Sulfitobacter med
MSAPTAAQAMAAAAARLRAAGVPDPARDARILLAHAASVDAARVTLIAPEEIAPEIAERFEQLVALRAVRVPVSQLIGSRGFYGRDFRISRDVLDPRPETETLIELALSAPFERVLDLGTGSGCILVTLLAERRTASGVGADLSEAACLQASANAVLHEVAGRAEVIQSDWFDRIEGRFDLIVSNPPYLAATEMADVAPELRDHEPAMALTDGLDGLSVYRIIADQAQGYLTAKGRVLVEIGWQQGDAVCAIFRDAGWAGVTLAHDLDGRPRVVCADTPA